MSDTTQIIRAPNIPARHGFSTRRGGVSAPPYDTLNLGPAGEDTRENILQNFDLFCRAAGVSRDDLVFSRQVHEDTLRIVSHKNRGEGLQRSVPMACDGLITRDPDVALCVFSADCVPVLLYDPITPAVAAVHAGWRGTARGIVQKAVLTMRDAFGTEPGHLMAAVGPSIGPCCFETDMDVYDTLRDAIGPAIDALARLRGAKAHIDLKALNALWLTGAGLSGAHIWTAGHCTCCEDDLFFSHRRQGPKRGLMAAVIQLTVGD